MKTLALVCAACTTTSVISPLAPRVLFATTSSVLVRGQEIGVDTSWRKTCEDRDLSSAKAGPKQYGCGDRDYTVDITCEGACTITPKGGPPVRDALHTDSKRFERGADGEIRFVVLPMENTLVLTVVIRSGDEVKRQSETYRWMVADDVVR